MKNFSLQGKLLLFFLSLVVLTNGLFAVIAYSRERLYSASESTETAIMVGKVFALASVKFFQHGDSSALDRLDLARVGSAKEFKITIYDKNWWYAWGDEPRVPIEGFPDMSRLETSLIVAGDREIDNEVLLPIIENGVLLGAAAVGIPIYIKLGGSRDSGGEFMLIMLFGLLISVLFVMVFSKKLFEQLQTLINGIENFGKGDYSVRIVNPGSGDIKQLTDTFNRMALTVQNTYDENVRRQKLLDSNLQELQRVYDLMRCVMSSVNVGIGAFDQDDRLLTSNSLFAEFLKCKAFSENESIGEIAGMIPDAAIADWLQSNYNTFKQDFQRRYNELKIAGDGPECVLSLVLLPLKLGNTSGVLVTIADITERKTRENSLIESEKWAILGRLAASVAHEIRNPLVSIRSLVEIIGDEVQGTLKQHAKVITSEVDRLNRVVSSLLNMLKPESARLSMCVANDIIEELVLLIRHEAAKNSIKICCHYSEPAIKISADTEKIKQAVLNLVLNGIQAIGKNGQIDIFLEADSDILEIAVCNDGPGISDEVRKHIFEPFYTTRSNGTGLGLAVTKKVAELHNGELFLADGEQVKFVIRLPRKEKR